MRRRDRNQLIERMARLADERVKVCQEAADRYNRDGQTGMATTERCAMAEARYLAEQIRKFKRVEPTDDRL